MSYMGDQKFWNKKFEDRQNRLMPDSEIVANIERLGSGKALDIGCGDGRNALYLLEQGFHVTAVDFSEVGLKKLRVYAKDNPNLITKCLDFTYLESLSLLDTYDLIVMNHFKIEKELLNRLPDKISKGGKLYVSGFSHEQLVNERLKISDLWCDEDFSEMNQMTLLYKKHFEDVRGKFVTYIFERDYE